MNRRSAAVASVALLALTFTTPALAHDPPPGGCGSFSTDVARELALMREPPVAMTASSASDRAPQLSPGKHYAVSLLAQEQVRFGARPGRATRAESPRGGVLRFEVAEAGVYRVSINTTIAETSA